MPWAHYYGMEEKTALGSHREVRITRNSMDPAKLRWDQFISLIIVLFQYK